MKIRGNEITFGADPEILVSLDTEIVSAHHLVPGTKMKPHKVDKGAVQVDGVALEFNIDPAKNFEEFQSNLDTVQDQLKQMIDKYEFTDRVSETFSQDSWDSIPSSAKVLGCSADCDAYGQKEKTSPKPKEGYRCVGGHVHIGGLPSMDAYDWNHFLDMARLCRILETTVGVYSVLWDKDHSRRNVYGQAGSFRPKTYGMEYRTLSNKWIFSNKITKFVFDGVVEAVDKYLDPSFVEDDMQNEVVQHIINTNDVNNWYFLGDKKAQEIKEFVC